MALSDPLPPVLDEAMVKLSNNVESPRTEYTEKASPPDAEPS